MKNHAFKHPTPEELYAIERRAHLARAAEMARVLRSLVDSLKSVLARAGASRSNTKGIRHA